MILRACKTASIYQQWTLTCAYDDSDVSTTMRWGMYKSSDATVVTVMRPSTLDPQILAGSQLGYGRNYVRYGRII